VVVGPAAERKPMVRQGYLPVGRLHREGGLAGSEAAWSGANMKTKANTSRERLVRNKRAQRVRASGAIILQDFAPIFSILDTSD
jgi:hypothetical protein